MPYAHRRDPDARREYMRTYTNALRTARRAALVVALGGRCERCGATEQLEFHHRDAGSKVDNVMRLLTAKKATLWREAKKCILLCHSCHAQHHANRGEPGPLESAFRDKRGHT